MTGQEQQIALDKFPTEDELVARYYAELNGGKGISDLEKKIVSQPYYSSQNTSGKRRSDGAVHAPRSPFLRLSGSQRTFLA